MDVSILISVHNRLDLTQACINSIFETMPSQDNITWELLIYDDQSTDGTTAYLSALAEKSNRKQPIKILRQSNRGTFAANNNHLATKAQGRWLLFLNNDTICLPNWFEPLYEIALNADAGNSNAAAAAVVIGGLQVFPGQKQINHAGVVIDHRGLPSHLYEGLSADLPVASQTRQMQAVTAACWLTKATTFRQMNGFHEGFRNGYEDVDYCLRVRQAGAQVWYCGASRIIHHGSCTSARFDHESQNQTLFLQRSQNLAHEDLTTTVKKDGIRWPVHTIGYRALRALWTGRLAQPVVQRLLRFRFVIQLRNQVIRLLTPATQISKD